MRLCCPLLVEPLEDEVVTVTLERPGSGGVPALLPLLDDINPVTERDGAPGPKSEPYAEDDGAMMPRADANE